MSMISRERVTRCLKFETPDRVPGDFRVLPNAVRNYPETAMIDVMEPENTAFKSLIKTIHCAIALRT